MSVTAARNTQNTPSLEQAYKALCEQAYALLDEFEASQIISEVSEFETEYLEKQTADELSIAGGLTLGLAIFHSTMKVLLPSRVAGPVVGSAWVLGGAYFVFRLTSTTIRGWVGQTERNKRRKRRILRKLEALEDRIHLLGATQRALDQPSNQTSSEEIGNKPSIAYSPAESTSSSAELIEAPSEVGKDGSSGSRNSGSVVHGPRGELPQGATSSSWAGWRAYTKRFGGKND